ncbi:MAG: YhcH/YjgK/YiaL family protein [Victivallales bacterium]|nr:YhcH/YjgK/YiaL family protein [Victivallales bacterium]
MIIDKMGNHQIYVAMYPGFDKAFAFLESLDVSRVEPGRIDINTDNLFAIVAKTEGRGRHAARLESHSEYIDIQFQVAGTDTIGWAAVDNLSGQGYDKDKDIEFFHGVPELWFDTNPGYFSVFFPHDAHAPLAGTGAVTKVVVKIRCRK